MSDQIHDWFGLSYANYLVLPRVLMQKMPEPWQKKMVKLLEEFEHTWEWEDGYEVRLRGEDGRYKSDPLSKYRHPDKAVIHEAGRK